MDLLVEQANLYAALLDTKSKSCKLAKAAVAGLDCFFYNCTQQVLF